MNVRWLKKSDGTLVLQQEFRYLASTPAWEDIPTVEEPRKAQRFLLYKDSGYWKVSESDPDDKNSIRFYQGQRPPTDWITVEEILEP